jgi:long-subunit fatty acid transport protein
MSALSEGTGGPQTPPGQGVRAGLLAAALMLLGTPALASVPELYGNGARAVGMGGAMTALAADGSAAFYNPALLVEVPSASVSLHTSFAASRANLESLQPGRNVDTTHAASPNFLGGGLGVALPIGGKVQNRVALGLELYSPATRLLRARAPDPNVPYLYFHHNSPERMVAVVAAGIKVLEGFSLGLGAQMMADLDGQGASVGVDLFSKKVSYREIDSGLNTKVAPVLGLFWRPVESLRLAASYRGELDQLNHIPALIKLEGLAELEMDILMRNHFTPHTFTLGVAFEPMSELTLSVDTIYGLWSRAPSPYTQIRVKPGGPTLDALGLTEALEMASPRDPPGFADTLSVRGGMEWRASDALALRAGAGFRPTPVPRQSAPGAGVGLRFNDPLEFLEQPLLFDVGGHASLLLPREANKEATDEVPPYRYSGAAFGVMGTLRYHF